MNGGIDDVIGHGVYSDDNMYGDIGGDINTVAANQLN